MNVWKEASNRQVLASAGFRVAISAILTLTDLFDVQNTMVLMGTVLVITGNWMPKVLPPLDRLRRDAATEQAVRRRLAWC